MARRDGGFLFRFFGSAGFSYGVDRGDSPIARSRTWAALTDLLSFLARASVGKYQAAGDPGVVGSYRVDLDWRPDRQIRGLVPR